MKSFKSKSTSEQLAEHLRGEVLRGAFGETMPGIKKLVRGLGVNSSAVADALKQLEEEGILAGQEERCRHRIVWENTAAPPALRIAFLPFGEASKGEPFNLEVLRTLTEHGHDAYFTGKTLMDLHLEPRRVAGMVGQTRADAWIVTAAQRPVLEWFIGKGLPAFSLYGVLPGLPIAGMVPEHAPVLLGLIRRLIGQGHRRIAFLLYRGQLELSTARLAPMLLAEMEKLGIPTSRYNAPQWEDSPEGFRRLLDSMFQHSPPTALIIEEVPHLIATLQFCGQRGIRVPEDLSLVCMEHRPELDYCMPAVAHIRWDKALMARRIARWADHVARGREDHRQGSIKAVLVEGGTIGPAAAQKEGGTTKSTKN